MNELVFLRHGHALSAREAGVCCDAERPLSDRGEEEVRLAASRLREAGFSPDVIVASPFARAARTAAIAASVFPSARLESSAALSDGPVQAILEMLDSHPEGSLLVVGHQPLLGAAAGFCLDSAPLDLSPAGFIRIRRDERAPKSLLEVYAPGEKAR